MIKNRLIAGLLVWLPLGATIVVVRFLLDIFNNVWVLIPEEYLPEEFVGSTWINFAIEKFPGVSAVIFLTVIVYFTGYIVSNLLGKKIIALWENFLGRIPGIRVIYGSIKQMSEAIFASSGKSFEKVYLVEYPRKELWTLAFETSDKQGESHHLIKINKNIDSQVKLINLFVPTTPNPTSGYFIIASPDSLIEVNMSVEDTLKMIVSAGVFVPKHIEEEKAPIENSQIKKDRDRVSELRREAVNLSDEALEELLPIVKEYSAIYKKYNDDKSLLNNNSEFSELLEAGMEELEAKVNYIASKL